MTQKDKNNIKSFGHAYNNIGNAIDNLCEITGNGSKEAKKK